MAATEEELTHLQKLLLAAVLLGQTLPDGATKVILPDLQLVTAGDSILLLDENLHGPISDG